MMMVIIAKMDCVCGMTNQEKFIIMSKDAKFSNNFFSKRKDDNTERVIQFH